MDGSRADVDRKNVYDWSICEQYEKWIIEYRWHQDAWPKSDLLPFLGFPKKAGVKSIRKDIELKPIILQSITKYLLK